MAKNTSRRKKDIKSKLVAAICMLLVSSIMMVSSTYAWFTLSTAPEVSGITTTIGSNGNLEIALSPLSGLGSDVGDAGLTTGDNWGVKNLTWGNLVDMGYAGNTYGLDKLTLAPAMLALTSDTNGYTLGDNALGTPSYGSDGRISGLDLDAYIAGRPMNADGTLAEGYSTKNADYGVRAVGTASGMTPQESKLRSATSAIGNHAASAIAVAANSLTANGDVLAAMLVMHADNMDNDTNNYAKYVPALKALTSDLSDSLDYIDEALRASLAAAASTIDDEAEFDIAIKAIEGKTDGAYNNSLDTLITNASTYGFTVPANFETVLNARNELATRISKADTAADALMKIVDVDGDGEVDGTTTDDIFTPTATVNWSGDNGVSAVLGDLMNTSGTITVNGYTIGEIKENMGDMNFLLGLATNLVVELGEDSGVYYDLALITGNITAKVPEVPITARGMSVVLKNAIIKTTVPANTSYLPIMKTAASNLEAGATTDATVVLDAFYGYVIDLMVRTNAADSNLLLQTDPAQRVYSDSTNADTQGKGTSIVFTTTDTANLGTIQNLVKSINIVFFDPSHANAVFGMAKVNSVITTEEKTGTKEVENEDGSKTTVDVITYTVTGYFELCEIANVTGSYYEAGEVLESNTLCALTQNVPQAISALVYLDGQEVTSADVLADENVTGALNLQFASDGNLKPMENSDLRNGTEPANP